MATTSLEALANNTRRLRLAHNLSLGQLSERSGVAAATLFKIENQGTNPTLETLVAIAETFSVTVEVLLAADEGPAARVVRAGEGIDISDDAMTGRVLMRVMQGDTLIEVHDIEFRAGHTETSVSHGIGAREHLMVLAGSMDVGPVDDQTRISSGDYATYPADRPHRWNASAGTNARVLVVHTFPQGSAGVARGGL